MRNLIIFATQMTESGGIENHLVRLCEYLSGAGCRILFLCADYRAGLGLDSRLRAACEEMLVLRGVNRKRPAWQRLAWLVWKMASRLHSLRGVLYLNGQGNAPGWVAKILKYLSSRTILHHHSSGDSADLATWPVNYRQLMKTADRVVACSETNARLLEHETGRKVDVVYAYSEPCCGNRQRLDSSTLNFGFFGRLIPEKGIGTILKLAGEPSLADIQWHLWGSLEGFPSDFTTALQNVEFHGIFHNREGLLAAMSHLDAFVLFSTHNEGLPLVLLEAMSAGVPWIASDRGGIRDLVVDPLSTTLLPRDFSMGDALAATRSLANAIRSRSTNPEALRRAYECKFYPSKLTDDWLRIFGFEQ